MKTSNRAGLLPALAILALVQACTLTPHNLHLDPVIDVTGPPVTSDTLIGLAVRDARPTKKLGEVGDPQKELMDVTLDEDITMLLYARIAEALEKRGFSVIPESDSMTRAIIVNVDSLVLNSVRSPIHFETELKAELSAAAHNASEKYDRLYQGRSNKETTGPPFEKHSNYLVNKAVSQALADMLNDDNLFDMLAR